MFPLWSLCQFRICCRINSSAESAEITDIIAHRYCLPANSRVFKPKNWFVFKLPTCSHLGDVQQSTGSAPRNCAKFFKCSSAGHDSSHWSTPNFLISSSVTYPATGIGPLLPISLKDCIHSFWAHDFMEDIIFTILFILWRVIFWFKRCYRKVSCVEKVFIVWDHVIK